MIPCTWYFIPHKKAKISAIPTFIQHSAVSSLTSDTGQEKEIKGIEIKKQKIKLFPFVLDIMYYRQSGGIHRRKKNSCPVWVAQVGAASPCHQKCWGSVPNQGSR